MHALRRTTPSSARRATQSLHKSQRRQDSHTSDHTSTTTPQTESIGRGFYIALAAIPASFALYKLSRQGTDEKPWLTRFIDSFSGYRSTWDERNSLHTKMVEQAGADRALFHNSPGSGHIELRFPEIFNSGSQMNVPAGQGGINLDKVIAHYEKQTYAENERKLKAMREGTLEAERSNAPAYRVTSEK